MTDGGVNGGIERLESAPHRAHGAVYAPSARSLSSPNLRKAGHFCASSEASGTVAMVWSVEGSSADAATVRVGRARGRRTCRSRDQTRRAKDQTSESGEPRAPERQVRARQGGSSDQPVAARRDGSCRRSENGLGSCVSRAFVLRSTRGQASLSLAACLLTARQRSSVGWLWLASRLLASARSCPSARACRSCPRTPTASAFSVPSAT